MPLFPYDRFDIASPLPAAEVCARLAGSVEPKRLRLFEFGGKRAFEGVVEGNRFRVRRVIGYANSFLPSQPHRVAASTVR